MREVKGTTIGVRRSLAAVCAIFMLVAAACGSGDDRDGTSSTADTSNDGGSDDSGDFAGESADLEVSSDDGDSGGRDDAATQDNSGDMADDADGDEAAERAPDESGAGGTAGAPTVVSPLLPADLGRSIIYTATTEVVVDDVPAAAAMAKNAIATLGGLVFGEQTSSGEVARTTLEFKVLPADFQEALGRLEGLGDLQSQNVSADDVTERVVDLRSRISTAEVSVERLRELLAGQTDLEDIAQLENQLLTRETDLETLRGQLRTIEDQIDLATIFLTLREAEAPALLAEGEFEVTFYDGADDGNRCPGNAALEIDEGEDFTVCVTVANVGSTSIGDIEIRDHGVGLDDRDFSFLDADDDLVLAPGESAIAWGTSTATSDGRSSVSVSAVAIDGEGNPLRVATEFEAVDDASLPFIEDTSLPGFNDALDGSWNALQVLVGILVLLAGVAVPFLWVPVVVYGIVRWQRSRDTRPAPPRVEGPVPTGAGPTTPG